VNNGDCCSTATLPLRGRGIPRMYGGLTAITPGCVAFSLPVQRRNLRFLGDSSVFPPSPSRQRGARLPGRGGFEPERYPAPSRFRGGFREATWPLSGSERAGYALSRRALKAPHLAFSDRQGGRFRRQTVPDGPTLDAPDCVADQYLRTIRDKAEPRLRAPLCASGMWFGAAPRVAFRPSPHPRIRWTVASPGGAIRAQGKPRPPPPRVTKCPTKC
jgi:hypothetical protein